MLFRSSGAPPLKPKPLARPINPYHCPKLGDGHPHITCQEPIAVEALQLLAEAYTGDPIGLPGYPPNFKEALGDPIGFMALCYMLSERIPHFSVIGDNA